MNIKLTKSQRQSLRGQIVWANVQERCFYASHSCRDFMQRIGAANQNWRLTDEGAHLITELFSCHPRRVIINGNLYVIR